MTTALTDEQRAALDSPHAWDVVTSQALLEDVTEPRGVMVLTDEELLALDGTGHRPVVALPWASEQESADEVLAGVAARSLVARGLLVTAADARKHTNIPEAVLGERELVLAQELNGITVLRKVAQGLVSFNRVVADDAGTQQMHHLYYYLQQDGLALEEEVTPNGMHHFTVLRVAEDARDRVRVLLDAHGAATRNTEAQKIDLSQVSEESDLGRILLDARAITSGTSIASGSDATTSLVFYTASDRVLLSQPLDGDAEGASLVREVDADALLEAVDFVLSPQA